MDDLISRQAVLDLIADYDLSMGQVVKGIHNLPSATPQPKTGQQKTGHWLSQSEYCKMNNLIPSGLGCYFWCSECNCGIDYKYFHLADYNYCPKCGIKMQEVKK